MKSATGISKGWPTRCGRPIHQLAHLVAGVWRLSATRNDWWALIGATRLCGAIATPTPINTALMKLRRRAEAGSDPGILLDTFVDVGPLVTLMSSEDH